MVQSETDLARKKYNRKDIIFVFIDTDFQLFLIN